MKLRLLKSFNGGDVTMQRQYTTQFAEIDSALWMAGPDAPLREVGKHLKRSMWTPTDREERCFTQGRLRVDLCAGPTLPLGLLDPTGCDGRVIVVLPHGYAFDAPLPGITRLPTVIVTTAMGLHHAVANIPYVFIPKNVLKVLQADDDGRALLADVKAGRFGILACDISKLSKVGMRPTMGRFLDKKATEQLHLAYPYVAAFDPAYTQANCGSYDYGEFARMALVNEHKAYVLRDNPTYQAADEAGKQKMELDADKNLNPNLYALAVTYAKRSYNPQFSPEAQSAAQQKGQTPPHPTRKDMQVPPRAVYWTVP